MAPTASPSPGPVVTAPVHQARVRVLHPGQGLPPAGAKPGPVVYWMLRDQRLADNWALLHAASLAAASAAPLAVAFSLFPKPFLLSARRRQLGFLLRGLRRLAADAATRRIPFFLLTGGPTEIPALVWRLGASALVADFSPLRPVREALDAVVGTLGRDAASVAVHQVDAHNVVPVWAASGKLEYSAKTFRSKMNKVLDEYLVEFPELAQVVPWDREQPKDIDWDMLIDTVCSQAEDVPEIDWCEPGEAAAMEALLGTKDGFLTKRIKSYDSDRNYPTKPTALSGLSPYLHFGHISAQRCALEAKKRRHLSPKSVDAFLEELIIRRELADNFCYYQPHYDSVAGAWEWARKTLKDHAADKREHIYTREQLENAKTADPLWNASQLEMVHHGKMHGFMRMYWAKKILEWTSGPEEALSIAIYLNDKYHIDGRDPNGYVGCMWSICGLHDQGWKERPVFGKIRYMNYAGCKRKLDVDAYISYVKRLVAQRKKRKLEESLNSAAKYSKSED
ncbi:deoxyribodipyrimidine photo-lyase [Hordeum vulgare]|uniref:Deoxyribodipyrimidine photo-lyase n=1 Tax=Hordeum vulgare subsp. vulgare TaxID=112509 RepID=A0A8I6YNG9_HORVV|nr:deoxyribodipyrimidine photo-lyase [Hordeum vulgare subsp. vulgare]KAE8806919.1 deoxyribodipyrimidine photo-lyase [Hordeum vulgare]